MYAMQRLALIEQETLTTRSAAELSVTSQVSSDSVLNMVSRLAERASAVIGGASSGDSRASIEKNLQTGGE